ncbi:HD domain-containing phosphohydrolase [Chloroflexota bacterium]
MGQDVRILRILICDDDPQDRKLVVSFLRKISGQKFITTEAGQEVQIREAISKSDFDIILMDLNMPDASGMEWLKEISKRRLAPVVILTGYGDEDIATEVLQCGAFGYLPKRRLSAESLANTIDDAIEKWRALVLSTGEIDKLARFADVDSVTGELIRQRFLTIVGKTLGKETVEAIAKIVEFRDPYTAVHQQRVTKLACTIAEAMALPEETITSLHLAGLVHDIGKVGVPAEILCNPGRLSEHEFNIIRMHPKFGYEVLKDLNLPWPIADIVHQHHERIDGSGYPLGLLDGEILKEAKILSTADVVEAMASHRPYRPALGVKAALEEIKRNKGRLYDLETADTCLKVMRKLASETQHIADWFSSSQVLLERIPVSARSV